MPNAGEPEAGEALFFAQGERDLVTSPLQAIERPTKELVEAYPELPAPKPKKRARTA